MENNKLYKIDFESKTFDSILCLDANLPEMTFFKQLDLPIIAADGGAIRLLEHNIIADFVIGDLDTFQNEHKNYKFPDEKIIYRPDQEQNDFEKALIFSLENNYNNILIVGFHGGELEHTLNNISIFKKYANKANICLYDEKRYGIFINQSIELETEKNEIISLIPMPKAVLTTENLKWELSQESLELGTREGARNRATSDNITIILHSGSYIIFLNNRLPYSPNCQQK